VKSANPWKRIFDTIGTASAAEMLAEEAAELSASASKYARILRGENPARMDADEAEKRMIEEIADVFNALDVLDTGLGYGGETPCLLTLVKRKKFPKMKRWYKDLFGKEERGNETN
jgi:hypothetical protein